MRGTLNGSLSRLNGRRLQSCTMSVWNYQYSIRGPEIESRKDYIFKRPWRREMITALVWVRW